MNISTDYTEPSPAEKRKKIEIFFFCQYTDTGWALPVQYTGKQYTGNTVCQYTSLAAVDLVVVELALGSSARRCGRIAPGDILIGGKAALSPLFCSVAPK